MRIRVSILVSAYTRLCMCAFICEHACVRVRVRGRRSLLLSSFELTNGNLTIIATGYCYGLSAA